MKVLVTGGAGFIGSHVVDALLKRGQAVTVLDDLSRGSEDNLKRHLENPNFRFIKADVRSPRAVGRALADVEAVIHEAAVVSVPLSMRKPELVQSVNVEGTENLLKHSSEMKIERFVHASSCAVYGEQSKLPISEEAPPNLLSPYASSKLEAERRCLKFHGLKRLETVCLRYFNVYGPGQAVGEYAGVMVKFIERLRAGKPPLIHGDGEQTRDFVHISDVVEATLSALERDVAGQVINVGTGKATSINRLCQMFLEATGRTHLRPIHGGAKAGDIRHSQADLSKARKLLGYKPKVPLERGIKGLLHQFKL